MSKHGLEVDKAKIKVIKHLPLPINLKQLRGFLGHAGFYRRFIHDFAKISKPLTNLLSKDVDFLINDEAIKAFKLIKDALIQAPIFQAPNWDLPFELMCDASDFVVGGCFRTKNQQEPGGHLLF